MDLLKPLKDSLAWYSNQYQVVQQLEYKYEELLRIQDEKTLQAEIKILGNKIAVHRSISSALT